MRLVWEVVGWLNRLVGVHPPPGPSPFWSWRYLDRIKTARMVMSRRVKGYYEAFPDLHPPGSEFPRIVLQTTDGDTIDTRDFLGQKHFVLVTGAIT
jgi:hypothetical protein